MSNASYVMEMVKKYAVAAPAKEKPKSGNPTRIMKGNVYVQATNVTKMVKQADNTRKKVIQDEALWKFHIVYIALHDKNGEMITGFSCNTIKLLEIIDQGIFAKNTCDNLMLAFNEYCEKYTAQGKTVILS